MREALARTNHDFYLTEDAPAPRKTKAMSASSQTLGSASRGSAPRSSKTAFAKNILVIPAFLVPLVRSPGKTLFGGLFGLALVGIIVNALVLQTGPHPHPLFAHVPDALPATVTPQANANAGLAALPPMPAPRPANMAALIARTTGETASVAPAAALPTNATNSVQSSPIAALIAGQQPQAAAASAPAPVRVANHEAQDPMSALIKANVAPAAPSVLAPMPDPDRVAGIQRGLIKLGLSPKDARVDGILGGTTRQAIEKFERRNHMPPTGDVSTKLARQISAQTGIAIP